MCDQLGHDRHDWGACPRPFLKRVVERASRLGLGMQATFENEYYLAREQDGRFVPFDVPGHAPVYSAIGHDLGAELMVETTDALEAQGITVEQAINEYGAGQREISVCSPFYEREEQSYNIEFKTVDGSANPYLALGSLIPCGLDGVERGLEPAEPSEHDPARMSPEELERAGVRALPASMGAALDELEKDRLLLNGMGDLLSRCYLAVRRSEDEAFSEQDKDFEIRNHFYRF